MTEREYIEGILGEPLLFQLASELGLKEWTKGDRPIRFYRWYNNVCKKRKARLSAWQRAVSNGVSSRVIGKAFHQYKVNKLSNRANRARGYPNLKGMWTARRRKAEQAREQAKLAEIQERQRRSLRAFTESTRVDL